MTDSVTAAEAGHTTQLRAAMWLVVSAQAALCVLAPAEASHDALPVLELLLRLLHRYVHSKAVGRRTTTRFLLTCSFHGLFTLSSSSRSSPDPGIADSQPASKVLAALEQG